MKDITGPAFPCKWCAETGFRKTGRIFLCKKHYRFSSMRASAKRNGKTVPSYEEIEEIFKRSSMQCEKCKESMNWFRKEGPSTAVSLQHDRSGTFSFLCFSCNSRHKAMPKDTYYELPEKHKYCPDCKQVLPFENFHNRNDRSRYGNKNTYCKDCGNRRCREWWTRNH